MDILSEILSSRIRAAILRLLFGFDAKEIYMRDLERRSGFSIGAIQTELKKLLRLELLKKRKDGNRIYFQANKEHPLYSDLRNLVLKTNGLIDIIKDALIHSEKQWLENSWLRRHKTKPREITDLFQIVEKTTPNIWMYVDPNVILLNTIKSGRSAITMQMSSSNFVAN